MTAIYRFLVYIIFIRRHRRCTEFVARMYLDVIRIVLLAVPWDKSQV